MFSKKVFMNVLLMFLCYVYILFIMQTNPWNTSKKKLGNHMVFSSRLTATEFPCLSSM